MFHHTPHLCQTTAFTSLTAVHVANVLDRDQPLTLSMLLDRLDRDYLAATGVLERLPNWWKAISQSESHDTSSNEKNIVC